MARHGSKKKPEKGTAPKKGRLRPRKSRQGARRATKRVSSPSSRTDNPHTGSSLDDLLRRKGLFEEFTAAAVKEAISWQVAHAMRERGITKTEMAAAMGTSRAQLDRLLDPQNESVTLATLFRAAKVLGVELRVELATPPSK